MTQRILFVCLGNICRSPMAEAVLRSKAAQAGLDVVVDGAATSGWDVGAPPDRRARAVATARGYDLSGMRARQITSEDFRRFALILAMDRINMASLRAVRPPDATAELRLFLDYAPHLPVREVPDPYHDGGFEEVLDLLEQASDALVAALRSA